MSTRPSRTVTAAFIGVFLIGVVVGGLAMMDYTDTRFSKFLNHTGDPGSMAARINQKYVTDYHLTPEEQKQIEPLVQEMTLHLNQARHQFGTTIITTLDDYHVKIAEKMTPEQREAYAKANADRKKWMSDLMLADPASDSGQK